METKEVQKRRSTARGRKKCETNLKAKPMNAIESRTAQVVSGVHNTECTDNVSTVISQAQNVEAAGYSGEDTEMTSVKNEAVTTKTENDTIDFFSEYFSQNTLSTATPYHAIDTTSTDQILEEADILLAEFSDPETPRGAVLRSLWICGSLTPPTSASASTEISNSAQADDGSTQSSDSVTLVETPNTAVAPTVAASADADSVMIVQDDYSSPLSLPRPIQASRIVDNSDEIILIDDEPDVRPEPRITATINLCSPTSTTPSRRKRRHPSPPPPSSFPNLDLSQSIDEPSGMRIFKCPICMDSITGAPPYSTICGHIFCGPCIKRAIKDHKKCPICNSRLSAKSAHPLFFN